MVLRRRPSPDEVVRAHGESVLIQLRRIFGPDADVDDVFQAVFVEVLRSLPSFRGTANLSTWIHRITLNVAYQHMRVRYRERERCAADTDLDEICGGDGHDTLERQHARRQLYAALDALPAKQRIAVVLHDIEGYTLKEIGALLGRPLQTVASQVRVGRRSIAAYFDGLERRDAQHDSQVTRRHR